MVLLIPLVLAALAVFWCYQFVLLMMMEDSLFPGKTDKPIWAAAFVFCAFLAPIAFLLWRRAIVPAASSQKE